MVHKFSVYLTCFVLGVLFMIPGLTKTVRFNTALQKEMLKAFKNYTEVLPLKERLKYNLDPRVHMQLTGVVEIILGTTLLVGTNLAKKVGALALMVHMLFSMYIHFALNDMSGIIVPTGYLGLLLWLYYCLGSHRNASNRKSKHE